MYRWCVVLLVACEAPAGIAPPAHLDVNAPPTSWPLGRSVGRIGRELAPQDVAPLTLDGDSLRGAPWQLPGDGSASAIVADSGSVELVDLDRRRVAWRASCGGDLVAVTASAIACASATATTVLHRDGSPAWHADAPFVALTDDRVVTDAGSGNVTIRDAATGHELATQALPAGIAANAIVAACDRELYAATPDGKLSRIAGKLVWSTPLVAPPPAPKGPVKTPIPSEPVATPVLAGGIDPCDGATVLAVIAEPSGPSLVALARDTGKPVGRIAGVRGLWPARGHADRIEVATSSGVVRVPRDLSPGDTLDLPPLGALLASRGDRRLVRATASTAVLLDARGVRAFVPLTETAAALGDDAILASGPRLFALPAAWQRPLRLPQPTTGIALPAELRDLPAPSRIAGGIALDGVSAAVDARALDPVEPAVYVAAHGLVARFDLAARAWKWSRVDGCAPGEHASLAASRSIVACATPAGIRATTRDGAAAWQSDAGADRLDAAADVVVARAGDRVRVLDARDGHLLGTVASAYAAALDIADMALVITVEDNRVVARLPRAYMLPAWSLDVHGVVRALAASGDGVVVALEDGDAYRIDARTAHAVALAGVGLAWRAEGDLVTGETAGGPVPPTPLPIPPPPLVPEKYKPVDLEAAPAIATPWPPPPPMVASWQLVMFELAGGVRARDDYALASPIAVGERRGPSPFVVVYGPRPRHVLVIDPEHGDPLRRLELPQDAPDDVAFSTIVDGWPVAGTILADPLRVVMF